jgi:surfactin synthase thioesterase subunit/NAD(P)-dependent dehydrogenase (short-subunit alcohol dehydrogenase family)
VVVRPRAPGGAPGASFDAQAEAWFVDPTRPGDLAEVFAKVASSSGPVSGVVYLWAEAAPKASDEVPAFAAEDALGGPGLLAVVRAIASHPGLVRPRLWLVTRGAQAAAGSSIDERGVAQSALLGMASAIALEQTQHWGGAIDLDPERRPDEPARLAEEVFFGRHDETVALRAGRRFVARLARRPTPARATTRGLDPEGVYLVTGGLGGLGRRVASFLASRGARHLVVTGRTAKPDQAGALSGEVARLGAELRVVAADAGRPEDMERVFAELAKEGRPLKGVVHSAGVVAWKDIGELEAPELDAVTRPKVRGAWTLHRLTEALPLDFFVLFSSIAGVWGSRGQAAYASANRFLDTLAHHRRAKSLPAVSIAWGPWAGGGMATDEYQAFLRRAGIAAMAPDDAMTAFAALLDSEHAQTTVADVAWEPFRELYTAACHARLLDDVAESAAGSSGDGIRGDAPGGHRSGADGPDPVAIRERLARLDLLPSERASEVGALVSARASAILRLRASVDPQTPLTDLGLDSLGAVELRRELAKAGLVVALENLLEGASVADITREALAHLGARHSGRPTRSSMVPRRSWHPGMAAFPLPVASLRAPRLSEMSVPAVVEASRTLANGWLVVPRPRAAARIRLVCFPYAGGGPPAFQSWASEVPPSIELGILHTPARGARLREAPILKMHDLADAAAAAIAPCLTTPFAFFGHCLGALLMFEVAQRLRRHHGLHPTRLFVSGARAPQFYNAAQIETDVLQYSPLPGVPGQDLPDAMLLDMLRDLNFDTSAALFDDEEMRRIMLPAVRADLAVNNTYAYATQAPLDAPITAIGGRVDPYVTGEHVLGWRGHTSKGFRCYFRPGDHYFMERERPFLIRTVVDELTDDGRDVTT